MTDSNKENVVREVEAPINWLVHASDNQALFQLVSPLEATECNDRKQHRDHDPEFPASLKNWPEQ
jgi:hypothetical protein